MANNGQQYEHSNGKRQSGSLGQTLLPPGETEDDAPSPEEVSQSPEGPIVPFSLDEFAALASSGGASGGGTIESSGKFSGEDIEFESFMFDSGNMEGVQLERQSTDPVSSPQTTITPESGTQYQPVAEAPTFDAQPYDATSTPITGQEAPMPPQIESAANDRDSTQTPPAESLDPMQAAMSNIEGLVIEEPVSAPYPTSIGDWSDQMLSSIDDFTVALLALRAGKRANLNNLDTPEESPVAHLMLPSTQSGPLVLPVPDEAPAEPEWRAEGVAPTSEVVEPIAQVEEAASQAPAVEVAEASAATAADGVKRSPAGVADGAQRSPTAATASKKAHKPKGQTGALKKSQIDKTAKAAPVLEQAAVVEAIAHEQAIEASQEQPTAEASALPMETTSEEPMLTPMGQPDLAGDEPPPWANDDTIAEMASSGDDGAQQEAQTFEALAEGTWLGDLAAQKEVAPEVTDEEGANNELPVMAEGKLSGEDLEFESFMFDQGATPALPALPNIGEFMPAVQSMEEVIGAVSPTASDDTEAALTEQDGPLPFWLQDNESDIAEQSEATGAELSSPSMTSTPLLSSEAENAYDFEDLPPIEPFDFTTVTQPEEERLGFNTEELAGALPSEHEPMMITADLDVLADLIGKERVSSILDPRITNVNLQQSDHPHVETAKTITVPALTDDVIGTSPGNAADAGANSTSQMATDFISSESISGEAAPFAEAILEESSTADFEVSPFDIADLNLEDEESITGYLNTGLLNRNREDEADKVFTGTLFTKPNLAQTANWEVPDWIGETESEGLEAKGQTDKVIDSNLEDKHFRGVTTDKDLSSATGWMGTGLLASESVEEVAPPPVEEQPDEELAKALGHIGIFKARVSRFRTEENETPASDTSSDTSVQISSGQSARLQQEPIPMPVSERTQADAEIGRQTTHASQATPAPMSTPALAPTPTLNLQETALPATPASRPDPSATPALRAPESPAPAQALEPQTQTQTQPQVRPSNFEALQEIVANKPNDVGARMALAVAYAQAGQTDHALAEYQRLLQQRQVPASMLDMISDRLADVQGEAGHMARFHQVKGDLLMKQGYYQEAIEEYNKIK